MKLVIVGTLFLLAFLELINCSPAPFQYNWRFKDQKKSEAETRGSIMDKDEEGDGGAVEEDKNEKDQGDFISAGPSSPPKTDTNNKRKDKKSNNAADDIMSDLLHPKKEDKNTTTTMKPFVVVTNSKNKPAAKKPKPDPTDTSFDEIDLKPSIEKALEKATSIADNIGDAIKAAINSVASQLKNATDVTSSTACAKSSGCSSTQESADGETTPSIGKASVPVTSTTKRQRRSSSSVARWPPTLPLSGPQAHTFSPDPRSHGQEHGGNMTGSSGGVISQGKVGSSSEESGEEEGPMQMSTSTTNTNTGSSNTESNDGRRSSSQDEESESEDSMNSSSGRNNMTKNMPPGKSNKSMKPSSQRDVTLTVSGGGMGSIGTGSSMGYDSAVSTGASQMYPQQPSYTSSRKPGRCRPLTSGLSCIALSPDASQCSTDSGCAGTKKCCFYGCAPYTGIGICEYPILH